MRVELREVTKGRAGLALPATSTAFESGAVTLAVAETEQRPAVLGLIASGRMPADTGTVEIDGRTDAAAIRRAVALVDAPEVCDPAPDVTVAGVAAEELMFAGRLSNPVSVRRWLDANGFGALARTPIADVAPRERVALLLELTALRKGVEGIVLVSPDRHGGAPEEWWTVAQGFADRGLAVLVIAGEASRMVLGRPADGGAEPAAHGSPAVTAEIIEPSEPSAPGGLNEDNAPALTAEPADEPGDEPGATAEPGDEPNATAAATPTDEADATNDDDAATADLDTTDSDATDPDPGTPTETDQEDAR